MPSDSGTILPQAGMGRGEDSGPSLGDPDRKPSPATAHLDNFSRALSLGREAEKARSAGDESLAVSLFKQAVATGVESLQTGTNANHELSLAIAQWALESGDAATARMLAAAQTAPTSDSLRDDWKTILDVNCWREPWLVAAVRQPSPDEAALDELVQRHWKALFARCQMLTLRREEAADLAQDTWCRVLRARERLRPCGNFRAYLLMIATNHWRDSKRAALRAGNLADSRVAPLDAEIARSSEGQALTLADVLPDWGQLEAAERERLKHEIDHALSQLEVLLRDVLIARFIEGESCAEIAHRYGRTEQTASSWVRRAVTELKLFIERARRGVR